MFLENSYKYWIPKYFMADDKFLIPSSNREKIQSVLGLFSWLFLILIAGLLLTLFWYQITSRLPFITSISNYVGSNIANLTIMGTLYASFLGGIFFVPSPDEVIFYYTIAKNHMIFFTLVAFLTGYLMAQILNYYLGWKISTHILNFVSKRKLYKSRRYINKYGSWGIFVFNFLPFPAPLLSLGLGIAKYNLKRLLIWSFLGHLAKFLIIIGIYLVIGQI